MSRSRIYTVSLTALLFATGCTQQAVQVDHRGAGDFGPGATMSYSSDNGFRPQPVNNFASGYSSKTSYQPAGVYSNTRPVSLNTESNAHVQSIASNDLPPPPSTTTAAANEARDVMAVQAVQPAENMQVAANRAVESEQPKTLGVLRTPAAGSQSSSGAISSKPVEAPTATIKPLTPAGPQNVESQRVNPWTKNPRGDEGAQLNAGKEVIAEKEEKLAAKLASAAPAAGKPANFVWPVNSRSVVSGFGPKTGGKINDGINIAMNEGEPVWAASDGEVAYVGNELKGYGNMVLIKHSGNKATTYAHLSRSTVDKYQRVKQGDIIGYVGSSGNVSKPQLHFAIREGKEAVDPQKYLPRTVAGL